MSSLWVYTQTVESYPFPLPLRVSRVVVCPRFALGRLTHFVYGGVLEINGIVVVCLLDYISARVHYSRLCSTIVPSVACQTTEGEYLLLTILPTY